MIAVLIPYFLTAHFATNSTWNYGPQYNFLVKIDIMTSSRNDGFDSSMKVRLICRPKNFDSSQCYFKMVDYFDSPLTRLENLPFDINFNNKGIESLSVDAQLMDDQLLLNSVKYIANLLSVGADLTNRPDEIFKEKENFLQGECDAYFDVRHWPLWNDSDRGEYNLNSLPSLNKVVGEAIRVEKNRDLSNCHGNSSTNFVLSSIIPKKQFYIEKIVKMLSSWNHITVTDRHFESTAELKALIKLGQSQNPIEIVEQMFLNLESISPAENELQPLINHVNIRF